MQDFAFDPTDPRRVYLTSDMVGVFVSDDAGEQWRWSSYGAARPMNGIAVAPRTPDILYAVGPEGIYQSANRAKSWQLVYTKGNGFQGVNNASFGRRNSIFGERGQSIAVSPAGTVYVCTMVGDVIMSRDRGATWERRTTNGKSWVKAVVPVDERGIVVGLYEEGVSVSEDVGHTWRTVLPTAGAKLMALACHPAKREVLYALLGAPSAITYAPKYWERNFPAHLYRSDDGGRKWERVHTFETLGIRENVLWPLEVSSQGTLLLLTSPPNRSADGGQTWSPVRLEPREDDGFIYATKGRWDVPAHVRADPRTPRRWYMSNMLAAFRSDDDGQTWHYKVKGLRQDAYWFVKVNPENPNLVIASDLDHGLIRSTDGGETWRNVIVGTSPYEECYELCFSPDDETCRVLYALYAWPGAFLAKSTDGGETWKVLKQWEGRDRHSMERFCVIKGDKAPLLFVGEHGVGIWRSADEGETWELKNQGLPKPEEMTYLQGLKADKRGLLYVGIGSSVRGKGGVFKSTDAGETWQAINEGLGDLFIRSSSLEVDPNDPEVLWVGAGNTVYRSRNGGRNWEPRVAGVLCSAILVEPGNSNAVYLCSFTGGGSEVQFTDGLYRSLDGGNYFTNISGELLRTIGTTYRVYDLEYAWRGSGRIWAAPSAGGLIYTVPVDRGG